SRIFTVQRSEPHWPGLTCADAMVIRMNPIAAVLLTNLAIGWSIPFILGLLLSHILALFGIAIPPGSGAVIDARASVYPNLYVGLPAFLNGGRRNSNKRI